MSDEKKLTVPVSYGEIIKHKLNERALKEMRDTILEQTKRDPDKVAAQWNDPDFSFTGMREALSRAPSVRGVAGASDTLRENNAESAYAAFVRYGINKQINWSYDLVPTVYEGIADNTTSKSIEEWYAMEYRPGLPQWVSAGQAYPEVKTANRLKTIANFKIGAILALERELFDDDQTGKIKALSGQLGQGCKIKEEIDFLTAFFAYSTSGDANVQRDGSGLQLTLANIETVRQRLKKTKDPKGDLLLIQPNYILIDTDDEIAVTKMLENDTTVLVPGATDVTGYFNTMNVLKGKFTIFASPYVTQAPSIRGGRNATYNPWAIGEKNKGVVFQRRSALEMKQEDPNSGQSFEADQLRWRISERYGTDVADGLFLYYGN